MGTPDEMMAYSSLSKIDTSQNQRAALSNGVAGNNYPAHDYLYEPSFEPDFPEYDSRDDPFTPTRASPKVDLKTVLGGLVSIITGATRVRMIHHSSEVSAQTSRFLDLTRMAMSMCIHPSVFQVHHHYLKQTLCNLVHTGRFCLQIHQSGCQIALLMRACSATCLSQL